MNKLKVIKEITNKEYHYYLHFQSLLLYLQFTSLQLKTPEKLSNKDIYYKQNFPINYK